METKERILIGMLDLIWEVGLEKASIGTLSRRIKISPGNIYYYFKDKNEILNTMYYYCQEKITKTFSISSFSEIRENYTEDTKSNMKKLIKRSVAFFRSNPPILNYIVNAKSSSYLSKDVKTMLYVNADFYEKIVIGTQENGDVKPIKPEFIILFYQSYLYELLKQDILMHNIIIDDDVIDIITELLWSGISSGKIV